ncbi:MAG: winged helix-turn-helix domain-containing protein [Rhodobacteraceae bacterium]|nr:winged helix-turn-helix domain-containing protein [Paracoccaceae bacterium]
MATRSAVAEPGLLENATARRLFMDRHGLLAQPAGPGKGADLLGVIEDLGFVQLDSINTVARAHDLILFARRPAYRPKALKHLYERDRALFEHWTHDAAMIPMRFYPHWKLRFARDRAHLARRWKDWRRDGFEAQFAPVLQHIRDHGPAGSSDVGEGEKRGSGGWWDWHPSKTALEYLWRTGALTVVGRDGFQKKYDLTERVIDLAALGNGPAPEETIDWKCNAALDRLGFAASGEIAAFWDTVTAAEAKAWLSAELDAGRLETVTLLCAGGAARKVVMRPGTLDAAAALPDPPGRMRVLSPFDPMLRDRNRAQRLFGFHYRIEIFVPEAKRQYGYYVFPLLEGDRIVGRIDMKADRQADRLHVTALWPEPGVKWGAGRQARLEAELDRLLRLAGVSRVTWADGWQRA